MLRTGLIASTAVVLFGDSDEVDVCVIADVTIDIADGGVDGENSIIDR